MSAKNVPICGFKSNKIQYISCSIFSRVAHKMVIIKKSIHLTVSPLKCVPFVLKNDIICVCEYKYIIYVSQIVLIWIKTTLTVLLISLPAIQHTKQREPQLALMVLLLKMKKLICKRKYWPVKRMDSGQHLTDANQEVII